VLTLEDFLNQILYTPTFGECKFLWNCYGPNARYLDIEEVNEDKEIGVIYDEIELRVYQINVYDKVATKLNDDRLYKITWVDPEFLKIYKKETKERATEDPIYVRTGRVSTLSGNNQEDEYFEDDLQQIIDKVKEALDG